MSLLLLLRGTPGAAVGVAAGTSTASGVALPPPTTSVVLPSRAEHLVQPQSAPIDWSNSITEDLAFAFNPAMGVVNLVTGIAGTSSGSSFKAGTRDGVGQKTSSATDYLTFGTIADFITANNVTVLIRFQKDDGTNRDSVALGIEDDTPPYSNRCMISLPVSDGNVYWDFGGATAGSGRVGPVSSSYGMATWAFSAGARGMDVWKSGVLLDGNSYSAGRSTTYDATHDFNLFRARNIGGGINSGDLSTWMCCFVWKRQLSVEELRRITTNPWEVFKPRERLVLAQGSASGSNAVAAGTSTVSGAGASTVAAVGSATGVGAASAVPVGVVYTTLTTRPRPLRQPQYPARIARENPITRGLAFAYLPASSRNLATGDAANTRNTTRAGSLVGQFDLCADSQTNIEWNNSYLTTSDGAGTGDFAIAVLANPVSEATPRVLYSQKNDSLGPPYSQIGLYVNANDFYADAGTLSITGYSNGVFGAVSTSSPIDGGWHLYVAVRRSGAFELWCDGVQLSSTTGIEPGGHISNSTSIYASGQKSALGNDGNATNNTFNRGIAWAASWNRAPSATEIASLGNKPWSLFEGSDRPLIFVPTSAASASVAASAGTSTVSAVGAASSAAVASSAGVGAATGVGASSVTAVASSAGVATVSGAGAESAAAVASSSGVGAATGVGASLYAGIASSAGVATATATSSSTNAGVGSSAGVGIGSAVGTGLLSSNGASAGAATASGVGSASVNAVAASAGVGTASGVGLAASASNATASAAGTSTVTGSSSQLIAAAGSSAGVGTAVATATSRASSVATAAGVADATGYSQNQTSGAAESDGVGTAAGVGAALYKSVGTASGVGTATASSFASGDVIGSAAGTGTAAGVGAATFAAVGSSAGTSTVTGTLSAVAPAVASAAGSATVLGNAGGIGIAIGSSAGTSTCSGAGASTFAAVGSSDGTSTATGTGRATAASAGTSAGTSSATATGLGAALAVGNASGEAIVLGVGASNIAATGVASAAGTSTATAQSRAIAFAVAVAEGFSNARAYSPLIGSSLPIVCAHWTMKAPTGTWDMQAPDATWTMKAPDATWTLTGCADD